MTEILQYDSNRTNRNFNERDAAIGAMLITTLQWIEPVGFGLTRNMLFTNSQNRLMGSMLRNMANNVASNATKAVRLKSLFDTLYIATAPDAIYYNAGALYNLHERINFWNLVEQTIATSAANISLISVVNEVLITNPLSDKFGWLPGVIGELEKCLDTGIDIFNDIVGPFLSLIESQVDIKNNNDTTLSIDIVAQSNIATMQLGSDGIWKVVDSIIEIDRLNDMAQAQYDNSRPFIETVPGSNGLGQWDARYYPVYVSQKDLVTREENGYNFPLMSFNNRTFKLIASIPTTYTPVSTEDSINNLDTVENGLMPIDGDLKRMVAGIVGLSYDDGFENQYRHYFHCKNKNILDVEYDEIIEFNSNFEFASNPVELPATNHLMDACSLDGKIFSIDPIKVKLVGVGTENYQCLLITGNFTLTETSSSNVYTNVAIWNPATQEFLEYDVSQSINNFFENAANFFTNEGTIYKTDSYSKFFEVTPITHSPVVFGFGTKMDSYNYPVTNNLFPMSGPFFIIDVISDNSEGSPIIKLNFILPKDIKGFDENSTGYENYLTDITSYTVQKIGNGDFPNNSEVMLYTGKGIFYLDVLNRRVCDRSFFNTDPYTKPVLTYKIPMEALSGEVTNIFAWTHPNAARENSENYEIANFNQSFPKFITLDDRFNENIKELTLFNMNNNPAESQYINPVKLFAASGWSKLGGLANSPAEYNNVCTESDPTTKPVSLLRTANGVLVEVTNGGGSRLPFTEQTKLILAKLENRIEVYGGGWEPSFNNSFYSFQEIELPMGYGEIIYSAHLAIFQPI